MQGAACSFDPGVQQAGRLGDSQADQAVGRGAGHDGGPAGIVAGDVATGQGPRTRSSPAGVCGDQVVGVEHVVACAHAGTEMDARTACGAARARFHGKAARGRRGGHPPASSLSTTPAPLHLRQRPGGAGPCGVHPSATGRPRRGRPASHRRAMTGECVADPERSGGSAVRRPAWVRGVATGRGAGSG